MAQQQAAAIQNLQPEHPQLARAREYTSLAGMVGGDVSKVSPDELVRLTGSTDPTTQEQRLRLDQAIVSGHDDYRKHLATLFSLDQSAFGQAASETAKAHSDPAILARGRFAQLSMLPARTEQEDNERNAIGTTYLPHLADALNLKSATRDKERLLNQLDDTRTRQAALSEHLALDGQANEVVNSLHAATKGLPDAGKPLTDDAAKQHLLAEGTRTVQGETFAGQVQPRIDSLTQTAQEAEQQRESLARRAVSALPGQKEVIDRQMNEYASMAKANRAMARLLKDENPYMIAAKESDAHLIDDPGKRQAALADVETLKRQRTTDMALVENEKTRLARRETILNGLMPAADRKEEEERTLRMASQSVLEALHAGVPMTAATREATKQFGVNPGALVKNVMEARGAGLWEAQNTFAMLPAASQTTQQAGKIAQRFGVSAKDVMEGVVKPSGGGPGGGLDSKDLQQMFTSVVNTAAKISGESGMRFSTGADGTAQFEMGTIKDPKKLSEQMVMLAETQTFLPQNVREALLNAAKRLGGSPATAAAPAAQAASPEQSLRQKLGLAP
jgi:hypothetical protein